MAKTIRTKVYQFQELSEQAKENAINNYLQNSYDGECYYDELRDSINALCQNLDVSTGRYYSDISINWNIEEEITGARLATWICNNYGSILFKPKYIKCLNSHKTGNQFIYEHRKNHKGEPYTFVYSKLHKNNNCVLTGVCYDDYILQPIYDFLKRPENGYNINDLENDISDAIGKVFSDIETFINSDDYIIDFFEANGYWFTQSGEIFNS